MLYYQLLNGKSVDKIIYCIENGVNERTFERDIEEIRLFLSEIYSENQLLFERESNTYYLSGRRPKYIDRMDATVILKLLLESKAFRQDEMDGLLEIMLSTVSPYDAKAIKKYLSYEIQGYNSTIETAILKILGDLYAVLNAGYDIEVMMKSIDGTAEKRIVSPLEIGYKYNEFSLIAAQEYNIENIVSISLDQIVEFKSLKTTFAQTLKEKYYKTKEE